MNRVVYGEGVSRAHCVLDTRRDGPAHRVPARAPAPKLTDRGVRTALGELIRLGKKEGVDKFVLVSSAGVGLKKPSALSLDEVQNKKDEARGRWRPTRLEPAMLNEDVVKWKLRGEEMLRASGLPYTIVRSYSPPPRPWNDPKPEDFNIAILQGGSEGVSGVINRSDLGHVAAQALISPKTTGTTFEAINVPKAVPDDQVCVCGSLPPPRPCPPQPPLPPDE